MTAQMIAALEAALAQGYRVQLKQLKDRTIKMQTIHVKELKSWYRTHGAIERR